MPALPDVKVFNTGVALVEVKPDGPLHEYDNVPDVELALALRFIVPPTHAGPSLPAVVVGKAFTTTEVELVALQPEPGVLIATE